MHDHVLARLRASFANRDRGSVDQSRTAGRLFAGDYSPSATAGSEFGGSRLGLGVMHDLDGEVVSINGTTWRVPVHGRPIPVSPEEGIAFGIAAHGGHEHRLDLAAGLDVDGILAAIDAYLEHTHVDHEQVVCGVEVEGDFIDVVLRTVAPPTRSGETLGQVIDDETRFTFPTWQGTLVGFRFPDATTGSIIPGLHLHGLSHDTTSGGHLRNATTGSVRARIWVDDFHPVADVGSVASSPTDAPDFSRLEGPVQ